MAHATPPVPAVHHQSSVLGRHSRILFLLLSATLALGVLRAPAITLNLDSIAAMGQVPRFFVNTYRWGDRFFNGYDTLYVMPTQHRFNVKFKSDTWLNNYGFRFDDGRHLDLSTRASASGGIWLTYMAVSLGYDVNFNELFGSNAGDNRHRFSFQFNCMLFGAECYWESSDVTARLRTGNLELTPAAAKTDWAIKTDSWGFDFYYFFNHKHYSQAAAFNYGRIQVRSSGSFYAGLSFWGQDNTFEFSKLPPDIKDQLPEAYRDNYHAKNRNYTFKFGYGYNFVVNRRFTLGISEAPYIGLRSGFVNEDTYSYGLALYNRARLSFIFNHNPWFAGIVANIDTAIAHDRKHSLFNTTFNVEASVGYRFNLW